MNRTLLEIACFSYKAAWAADAAGADRIELCEGHAKGGLTPQNETLIETIRRTKIPVFCMVRSREDDIYSGAETADLCKSIFFFKARNVNGIVTGALTPGGEIDATACYELLKAARPMSVTFHRAFDRCADRDEAIKVLIGLGIDRLLTSGGAASALQGLMEIKRLQKTYGRHITIIPAGAVRAANVTAVLETGCREIHSSALGEGLMPDHGEIMAMKKLLKV
jgi:copper homeostasis protein